MRYFAMGALLMIAATATATSTSGPTADAAAVVDTQSPMQQQGLESVLTMKVESLITLDAQGGLVEFQTSTPMPEKLRESLDKVVMRWRFTPVLADGVARQVTTKMRITLAATQDGKNYRVKIDNVIFPGDPKQKQAEKSALAEDAISARTMVKPDYPMGLLKEGIGGTVLIGLRLSAEGKVEDAVAVQSSLNDVAGRPAVLAQGIKLLEASALKSARRWTFNVPASFANRPASWRTLHVPINYYVDIPKDQPGMWRTEVRTARREMGWLEGQSDLQHAGVSDVAAGEAIPVASVVRLQTEVVGAVIL